MEARDNAMQELERRLWTITTANGFPFTVASVVRNPDSPLSRFPCINVFEMDDEVETRLLGGNRGWYLRDLEVIIEFWREESTAGKGSLDAEEMYDAVRYALFHEDEDLGGTCEELYEKRVSRVMHPLVGRNVVGKAITLGLRYVDARAYTKA
jgi:hypothetical protein